MNKAIYKLLIAGLLIALAGLFLLRGPSHPATAGPAGQEPAAPQQTPETVYRRRDEAGRWVFSNQPEDAAGSEKLVYDGRINTIPAPTAPPAAKPAVPAAGLPTSLPSGMEALQQARELQGVIDQRERDIDAAVKSQGG